MKLSIIIPCYNEKKTILKIISKILKVKINKEIIIVDDGSIDGTRSIIRSRIKNKCIKKIYHKRNLGKGAAIKSAKKIVTGNIVIIQDADLEYYPSDYYNLIKPILDKKVNVVYGSRLLGKTPTLNLFKNKSELKILHITNFNERHNGRLFYNTGRRINNGFIRLNHSVLELSDRDIVSYSRKIIDPKGSQRLNSKLIDIVSNYVPDLIVFGHADLIDNKTIEFIKLNYPDTKLCQWFLDRMDGEWRFNRDRFAKKMHLMDANFCTTDPTFFNFKKDYLTYFMPNCVDPSLDKLKAYANSIYKSDVFFAMSHGVHRGVLKKGKIDIRENFIKKLIKITPNVKFDCYGINDTQPVWAENFLNSISQNKIGLNLSQGSPSNYYSSDRFSQLIGNGLLVMIDEKTKIGNFFNKDEIITYKNISDLSEKIIRYVKDDKIRKKIAKKGRDKYFKYFNSEIIAKFIINKTYGIKKKFFWEDFL